jgi:hypothetical protein
MVYGAGVGYGVWCMVQTLIMVYGAGVDYGACGNFGEGLQSFDGSDGGRRWW